MRGPFRESLTQVLLRRPLTPTLSPHAGEGARTPCQTSHYASLHPRYNSRMPLTAVTIRGYRSVRNLFLPVEACSVFVGANGVGKTNLYKALGLLRAAADGTITRAIAEEGGIASVLWAGSRRRGDPVRLILKAHFDEMDDGVEVGLPHSYAVEIGLRRPAEAAFEIEPLIKEERLVIRHANATS